MIQDVLKWRRDFNIQTTPEGAVGMLTEEYKELIEANDLYAKAEGDKQKLFNDLRKEWADMFVVLVQLGDTLGIDMEGSLQAVLKSNYTKRMTIEQFEEHFNTVHPDGIEVRFLDDHAYLYDAKTSKLLKPPTYEPVVWE